MFVNDSKFLKLLVKLKSDWFDRTSDSMAKSLNASHFILVNNYQSFSRDESFSKVLKKLKPNWFLDLR